MYTVGPLVAMWSDPFGLTKHRMVVAEATPLIVHPSTEAVSDRVISREWEDPPVRPPVSKPWPTGFEFYALRDYVSGDDPRRINWRATAKSLDLETGAGRYLVRESEQGITDHVSIFLDTDAEWHSPGTPSETFETGVKAAASLGVKHLKDGFSVTLEANGARLAANLRGETSRLPFLDKLAAVERERVPLARAIDRLLTTGRRNSHNVIVTPHLDPASATRLRLVMDRGTSLLLVVLLWEDSDLLTLHRAGSLGCNVVELNPKMALDRVFQRVVGMARR
jgi:uncharacterized protein (DUF58 family)